LAKSEQEPASANSANSAERARGEQPRGPNKISASTKYSFTGRNLTAYGGLLPLRLWFSQTPKLLINWGLPFFIRFPCWPPLLALAAAFLAFFRQRAALQLEILALRHQLGVLQRSVKRPKLTAADRFLWDWLAAVWTDWQPSSILIKPAMVIGWHRKGFRLFWTWKIQRGKPSRPAVPADVRSLIRAMSRDNPLWGAPRIRGELLKLGIAVGETSVSKYMVRLRKPPSQTWRTFLDNHVKTMVSVDFFTVPTIRFQVLYVFLVLAYDRRRILHFAVTAHPIAEWTAQLYCTRLFGHAFVQAAIA
jgi:hypothetical protein